MLTSVIVVAKRCVDTTCLILWCMGSIIDYYYVYFSSRSFSFNSILLDHLVLSPLYPYSVRVSSNCLIPTTCIINP